MRAGIPAISGAAMASVDRIMIDELGVDTLQLMELAGYGVADMARRHCGLDLTGAPRILALAGTGGNGGDALVAVRLLHAWGARAEVMLSKSREDLSGVTAHQLATVDRLGIPVHEPRTSALPDADLILDGLLGFSLRGDPRSETARLIGLANTHPAPVLAIDVPSGLDATSGAAGTPTIRADWTVTLALPKTGLLAADLALTGALWLADIGVPPAVFARLGVTVPADLFATASLLRLS
ncbi:MAG TPA: NAD(P)H-hydrate epimerase [Thermomicrobiales bacterium]|nr:NAD(P)H-hydrate epimerase [Thermomicrobiales bacterium]